MRRGAGRPLIQGLLCIPSAPGAAETSKHKADEAQALVESVCCWGDNADRLTDVQ